jgi:ABC-type multidrug transport system fused ATPase/permease subunit
MIDAPSLSDFYDLRIVFISCVWLAVLVNVVSALHRRRRDLLTAPLVFHFVSHAAMGAEVFAIIFAASSRPGTVSSIEDPDSQRLSVALQWTLRVSVLVWLILSRWLYNFVPRGVAGFVILLPVVSEWARVSLQLLSTDDLEPAQFSVDCVIVVLQCVSFCSVLGWKWLFATDVELLFRQIPESAQSHYHDSEDDRQQSATAPTRSNHTRHALGDGTRISDILPLDNSIAIEGAEEDMKAHWQRRGSVGWSLWSRWKGTLLMLGGVRLVFDILSLLPAYLLRVLVDNLSESGSTSSHDLRVSCVIVALLVLSSVVGTLMRSHYSLKLQRISLYNRGLLSDVILKHVIRTRTSQLLTMLTNDSRGQSDTAEDGGVTLQPSKRTQGDVLNHLTVDAQRVADGLGGLYDLWALPLQTALTLYLLYVQVSFAFVAGVVITVALIPVNMVLAKKISKVQSTMLAHNDERVLRINEVMNNMIYVKMCGWRPMMARWIREPREQYMSCLRWVKMLDALCVFFWATTPVFVSLATFALYIGFGGTLTAGRAVAALTLFNSLILPLNAYPWVINGTVEAYVSLKRLQGFIGPFVRLEAHCIRAVSQHVRPPTVWPTASASDGTTSEDGNHSTGENSDDSDRDESAPLVSDGRATTKKHSKKLSTTITSKFGQKKRRHVAGSLNHDAFGSPSQERSIPSIFNSGRRGASRNSSDGADDGSVARLDEVSNILITMEKVGFSHSRSDPHTNSGQHDHQDIDDIHDVNRSSQHVSRSWNASPSPQPFRIEVPRFVLRANECVAIVGPAGSGKSTFLSGLAGELWRFGGGAERSGGSYIVRRDSMALAEQTPFLTLGSIKHNVICGLPFRKDAFDRVMKMCALDVDLREFPEKENTILADRGTGLSGGQKYRVALARALYAEKSVTLVDDGLGSLDVDVANHVVDHVFSAVPQHAGTSSS